MSWEINRARVRAAIAEAPRTQSQVRRKTGLSQATVSRCLAELRERRDAHVSSWWQHPNGGPTTMTYSAGPGRDAPKPRVLTDTERTNRHRAQLRASGDWEDRKAKQRATRWAGRQVRPDPLISAFFGMQAFP